jgi:hypothetical protein
MLSDVAVPDGRDLPLDDIGELPGIDQGRAHVARMYDYYLGGRHNFEADRTACQELDKVVPGTRGLCVNNRAYLVRVVRTLAAEYGISQFIDIGSGLPTQDNVHQVARRVRPDCRVVYVDNDPIVPVYGRALIADDNTAFILHDVRRTSEILDHPSTRRLIDLSQPTAALYFSFLHQIPDRDDPGGLVATMMDSLAPGSFVAMSHLVADDRQLRGRLSSLMLTVTEGNWGRVRTTAEVDQFFAGMEVIPPGLVEITTWRPDGSATAGQTLGWIEYGGVARKPAFCRQMNAVPTA